MGSGEDTYGQAMSFSCPPPTAATLADFSKSPSARRTTLDLFSTVGKQPQSIAADLGHNVHIQALY